MYLLDLQALANKLTVIVNDSTNWSAAVCLFLQTEILFIVAQSECRTSCFVNRAIKNTHINVNRTVTLHNVRR